MIIDVDDGALLPRNVWGWLVKQRSGWRCEHCGGQTDVHAHHRDRDRTNNRLCNGKTLCRACHVLAHHPPRRPGSAGVSFTLQRRNAWREYALQRGPPGTNADIGPVPHVRRKIAAGRKLKPKQYRIALREMLYVPPELRPE